MIMFCHFMKGKSVKKIHIHFIYQKSALSTTKQQTLACITHKIV